MALDNFDELLHSEPNVEIKSKVPCIKSKEEQLEIMELYTKKYQENKKKDKSIREIECLRVLFPRLLRPIEEEDLMAGRMDVLPIGFGSVTSLGGVGHYCVFSKLEQFKKELDSEKQRDRVDALEEFWKKEDLKARFAMERNDGKVTGFFSEEGMTAPTTEGIRLSGMMLDYHTLLDLGIQGLQDKIDKKLMTDPGNQFLISARKALDLFTDCCDHFIVQIEKSKKGVTKKREKELQIISNSLKVIRKEKPATFHQALQMVWIYALLAGIINYGRLDDILGVYLKRDLEQGTLTEEEAYRYIKCLWTMVENKRTTVNGRIIVGGRGRKDVEAADLFTRIALDVCNDCRYVEPQFTLRIYEDTPEGIIDKAMECIANGATYPTLYNDIVNVPANMKAMNICEKDAQQYVPFGCGEFNIAGKSVSTPNSSINAAKALTIFMNDGFDPMDNIEKTGPLYLKKMSEIKDYNDFISEFKRLLEQYCRECAQAQVYSYKMMNENVSFLFNSILIDDCIEKGKALLDGGCHYLGGAAEIFGSINCADALYAVKKLVFDDQKYTLDQVCTALLHDFNGFEEMRKDMWECHKYGNDEEDADAIAVDLYETISKYINKFGRQLGLAWYGIVIINNRTNTTWGLKTGATPDGRKAKVYLNPSNNPQGGADRNGPTATLNSLAKMKAHYNIGSVQNIKFESQFMKENKQKIKALFKTYFKKGGCQLMVTVVDRGALEDATIHPEKYPDMLVRVSGFSAVFVELEKEVQQELLSRTLYEGF